MKSVTGIAVLSVGSIAVCGMQQFAHPPAGLTRVLDAGYKCILTVKKC